MPGQKGSQKARNSAARLLAVQAVYQVLSTNQDPSHIVQEYLDHRAGKALDGEEMVMPDGILFQKVVSGVFDHLEQLEERWSKPIAVKKREIGL